MHNGGKVPAGQEHEKMPGDNEEKEQAALPIHGFGKHMFSIVEQSLPAYPEGHVHEKLVTPSTQVPPFKHFGTPPSWQSSMLF